MQQAAPYLETLAKKDPQFGSRVSADREFILADGALSAKTKALMTLLCDSLLAHEHGLGPGVLVPGCLGSQLSWSPAVLVVGGSETERAFDSARYSPIARPSRRGSAPPWNTPASESNMRAWAPPTAMDQGSMTSIS